MALITSGGADVFYLLLDLPKSGPWTATALIDDPQSRTGAIDVTVNDGALVLNGTVNRGGDFEDTERTRIVGGADGLGRPGRTRQYNGTSMGIVLGDLLRTAGEKLSPASSAALQRVKLPSWTTGAGPIGVTLSALVAAADPAATWRVLPDGTVWVGTDAWADSGIDPDTYQVMRKDAEDGSWLVSTEAPQLMPGVTFEGHRVSRVRHMVHLRGDGSQMVVWFEDGRGVPLADRLTAAFARAVNSARPPVVDYRARYWGTIVAQHDGTVDVRLEIAGLPDMGSLPLYLGIPGARADGAAGGRVLVGWRGGDRSKGYAESFSGATVEELEIAVQLHLFLGGKLGAQPAVMGDNLVAYLRTIATAINGLAPGAVLPPDTFTPALLAQRAKVS